jgi:hypothetical protein
MSVIERCPQCKRSKAGHHGFPDHYCPHCKDYTGVESTATEEALRERIAGAVSALEAIADGRWNVGAPRDLDVREFARQAVASLTTTGGQ